MATIMSKSILISLDWLAKSDRLVSDCRDRNAELRNVCFVWDGTFFIAGINLSVHL